MKWTEQQEKAIYTEGSDILVSAAAGSGKTAVLTERIRRLIMEEGISVERMLIVTFSNAAAAEMKEKIIRALKKALAEKSGDAAALRTQIRRAREADISTFHKFSMGVIRRYFYLTDIEQNFGICDEGRQTIFLEEALEELMEDRFEGGVQTTLFGVAGSGTGAAAAMSSAYVAAEPASGTGEKHSDGTGMSFREFLRKYSDVRSEEPVKEMIREVYRFIMSMPDPFGWLDQAAASAAYDADAFRQTPVYAAMRQGHLRSLKRAKALCEQVLTELDGLPKLQEKAAMDLEAVAQILEAAEQGTEEALVAALDVKFQQMRATKEEKEDYALIKDKITKMRDSAKKVLADVKGDLCAVPLEDAVTRMQATADAALYLADLVKDFHHRFSEKKREKNVLDFNDIEHVALSILQHPEVAEEYRKHFEVIFIDEYQDSSILQETLIQTISRGNNVYMVGDVKQSIYKFRLAEPEIFIGKYNDFRDGTRPGIRIDLNRNFRSKGHIIHSVNQVFHAVMNRETCGIDYDEDAELKQGTAYEGALDYPTTLHLIDTELPENPEEIDEELYNLKSAELEARVVAELAAARIGKEIYDQKAEKVRTIGPSDIVVLMRGIRGHADVFAAALKEVGLPAYVDAGEGYFETTEIEVFMNLLRVIDNRRSDIPLLSVLYSPIFGFTAEELIQIRLMNKKCAFHLAFLMAQERGTAELAERCRRAAERLDRWRMQARFMPLEAFLWHLMKETNYLNYVSALPGGSRRAANLRSLVDKAVAFAETKTKGLFAFLRYVEALNQGKVSIGQALQTENGAQLVRIMTIHKSKGLEFPVVIVAGLGRRFNKDRGGSRVVLHKELGMALQYSDPERQCYSKTLSQKVIEARKEQERMAEEMRILYVAMTRPMDEMILIGTVNHLEKAMEKYTAGLQDAPEDAGCYLDWIVPHCLGKNIELHTYNRSGLSEAKKETEASAVALVSEIEKGFPSYQDTDGTLAELSRRFSYVYPYPSDVRSKSKFAVSGLNKVLKAETAEEGRSGTAADAALNFPEVLYEVPEFLKEEAAMTPAMRGTLTHKVLELIPFTEQNDEASIRSFVEGLPEAGFMSEKEAAAVDCGKLAVFFASEMGRRACRAQWLRREWHFTMKKDREEIAAMARHPEVRGMLREDLSETVLIQGIIDCCFRDAQGIVILDYKTDHVSRRDPEGSIARLKEEYRAQLQLYAEVVEKALDEPVCGKYLFLLDTGDVIAVE